MLKKFNACIDGIAEWTSMLLIVFMVVIALIQIFFRYAMSSALPWPEELGAFAFAWAMFMAIGVTMRYDGHIRIDFLMKILPPSGKKALRVLVYGLTCLFYLFVAWLGLMMTIKVFNRGTEATALPISLWVVWFSVPLGSVLTAYNALRVLSGKKDTTEMEGAE